MRYINNEYDPLILDIIPSLTCMHDIVLVSIIIGIN